MRELFYDIDTSLIAAVLLVSMAVAIEAGYRFGLTRQAETNPAAKEHINAIQSSILGILALLLGFTFSLSLQRFDSRSEAVVDEANAIGTVYLRTQFLPAGIGAEARTVIRTYVDQRVESGKLTLVDCRFQQLRGDALETQNALWRIAVNAAQSSPDSKTALLFVEAVNDLNDSFGRRDAGLNRHVPEVVLLLLYATFLIAGGIVGYSSGVAGHRPSLVSHVMVMLIVILVFLILDLDRPRRGLIQVSQSSLVELRASIQADFAAGGR